MRKEKVEGVISAGAKSMVVNKVKTTFEVPEDVSFTGWYDALDESDLAVESDFTTLTECVKAINTYRKNVARQAAYQRAITPYVPDTATPEQRIEQAITALVKAGVPESVARQNIEAMRATL